MYTSSFNIEVMNISKQSGAVDCGLHAIAVLTSLAFDQDPTTVVYYQKAMRPHLNTCFDANRIVPFPVLKHRRPANKVAKIEVCILHCYCRLPDDGYEMVCCDNCDKWYHKACGDSYCKDGSWLCKHCIQDTHLLPAQVN